MVDYSYEAYSIGKPMKCFDCFKFNIPLKYLNNNLYGQ